MEKGSSLPWSGISQHWGHPWHSMCSYLGSFPAILVRSLIYLFSDEGAIVLDPFCGRGTTLLEARLTGRTPLASDLNPIAVALTRAKNVDAQLTQVSSRINELERDFDLALYLPEALAQRDDIQLIYHPHTLARLCYLRRRLIPGQTDVDDFIVGVALGVMHGSERQDGSSAYASISMPNTFSMSPEYVRRFVQSKGLQRIERDVFQLLRDKTVRLFRGHYDMRGKGIVTQADAKRLAVNPGFSDFVGRVDLVITSPPYLDVVNYARQNWIRMWFLRENAEEVSRDLDDNLTLGASLDFLESATLEIKAMMTPGGVAVVVIGDVARASNNVISPARELIRRLREKEIFEYIGCISDHLHTAEKTTRIWGDTKGRATAVDRVLVLSDRTPTFRTRELGQELLGDQSALEGSMDGERLFTHAKEFAGLSS